MHELPDNKALFEKFSTLLGAENSLAEIVSREKFVEQGTYPIELVTCRMTDSRELILFCKYLAGGGPNNYGHRGGVEYEAKIYAEIISKIPLPHVRYYGTCEFPEKNELVVILEFIGKLLRFGYSEDKNALQKAASWVGAFHGYFESEIPDFIKKYDYDYYNYWMTRFKDLVLPFTDEFPILSELINYYNENVDILITAPQTIIHGEYYPRNVLIKSGVIYPVDWESTAAAPGEMDLASLIEHWDKISIADAKEAYQNARWPNGNFSKKDFEQTLMICRIHLFFRWCPFRMDESTWIKNEKMFSYLVQLCQEAEVCFGKKITMAN